MCLSKNTLVHKWSSEHRPWPIPLVPWIMRQLWHDLLFIHYPISVEQLIKLIPSQLTIDTFNGTAWISIVPFKMNNIGIRNIPGSIHFAELNVRTYVTIDNKPGVYFFSLDATNLPVVFLTNMFFNLPYIHSSMSITNKDDITAFSCQRKDNTHIQFNCSYKPISKPFFTEKGTLEYWLTERYCFYVDNKFGKIRRCEILHQPWPLQQVEVDITINTLPIMNYINSNETKPLFHYSKGVDVRVWMMERV